MTTAADHSCPRCGGAFHCGARDPAPCPCTTIALDDDTLATLRERYAGCLCLDCLRELQLGAVPPREPPSR